jgi:hypothetical protein
MYAASVMTDIRGTMSRKYVLASGFSAGTVEEKKREIKIRDHIFPLTFQNYSFLH